MKTISLRARLLASVAVLTLTALCLAWWLIAGILARFVADRFHGEQIAIAHAVMAGAAFDPMGRLTVDPPPADPRFERPGSGWAWQVGDAGAVLARSASLLSSDLGPHGIGEDARRRPLDRLHQDFTAPGDGRPLRVTVTMPAEERSAAVSSVTRPLALALGVLGLALLAGQWLGVGFGLRRVAVLRHDLARLARGESRQLPPAGVAELAPLTDEINRLLEANRATVQRARAHAGNLAHALKTPLAVLRSRARSEDVHLLDQMDRSVRWHLQRARAAGPDAFAGQRVSVHAVAEDLRLVLGPEAARRGLSFSFEFASDLVFVGEREDLVEMLGNLLENAVKWAHGRVWVQGSVEGSWLVLAVSDDGPGIAPQMRSALPVRGVRLDESLPGTGLGLAIVEDLVVLYGGSMRLEASCAQGLRVRLALPQPAATQVSPVAD